MTVEARLSRPDSRRGRLQRALLAALREKRAAGQLPTSNRLLFYELEQRGIVSKRKEKQGGRRPDQDLTDASKYLRDVGLVPWDWIVDERRRVDSPGYLAPTAATWAQDMIEGADLLDPWDGVNRPLVIAESAATAGVLRRRVCELYRCESTATSGQAGGFLVTDVAPMLENGDRRVLYFGDHDLAGNQIEENTRRVLEQHAGDGLVWERVALTEEQVTELQAEGWEPIEKRDNRYNDRRPHLAFECEILRDRLVTILRERLDELLPEPLADVRERERQERAAVLAQMSRLNGSG